MKNSKFEDLFAEELQELYAAENLVLAALPKMIAAASSGELAEGIQVYLDQTRERISRLESVFEQMGVAPGGSPSTVMESLLSEVDRRMSELEKSPVLDLGLIGATQKIKSYETAGYGMARSLAEILGQHQAADSLQKSLDEEDLAAEGLSDIAEKILSGENTPQGISGT